MKKPTTHTTTTASAKPTAAEPAPAPADMPAPGATLMIGNLVFKRVAIGHGAGARGVPSVTYTTSKKGNPRLAINAAQVALLGPDFAAVGWVEIFIAEGKPSLALFPVEKGAPNATRITPERNGCMKLGSRTALRALSSRYARIDYLPIQAIESPRKGWVLNASASNALAR